MGRWLCAAAAAAKPACAMCQAGMPAITLVQCRRGNDAEAAFLILFERQVLDWELQAATSALQYLTEVGT